MFSWNVFALGLVKYFSQRTFCQIVVCLRVYVDFVGVYMGVCIFMCSLGCLEASYFYVLGTTTDRGAPEMQSCNYSAQGEPQS